MIKKFAYKNLTWVDLESPTKSDIDEIRADYKVHDLVAREIHKPTLKPRVDFYNHYIYLILHFPVFDKKDRRIYAREVDFVLGKDFLISAHYEPIPALHELSKIFGLENEDEESRAKTHAGYLFFYIMRHLYSSLETELIIINHELEKAEEEVFRGKEMKMVEHLSVIGRHVLDFGRIVKPHKEILASFEKASTKFYGDSYDHYSTTISGEYYKLWNEVEMVRDVLRELRKTNDSLLTTKINDIMKFLTIMAFITLPPTLIATVFSMGTSDTPIVGEKFDFWIILGLMALTGATFFAFFKYKKWL